MQSLLETARKMAVLYDLFCRTSRTRQDRIYYGRRYRYWSARAIVLGRREQRGHCCLGSGNGAGISG